MFAPKVPKEHLEEALSWGINIVRYPVLTFDTAVNTREGYLAFVADNINHIRNVVIPTIAGKAIAVIDLHTPPGGGGTLDSTEVETVKLAWGLLIDAFNNNATVRILDLLNEPMNSDSENMKNMDTWRRVIRPRDKEVRVSISCRKGEPQRFNKVKKLTDSKAWYTAHMYQPMSFTHQGIGERPVGVKYPTNSVNKAKLETYLKNVRTFQSKTRSPIYIGEFSVSTYASPEARLAYIKDCISIFEKYGWNWTFHAFRENPIWNPIGTNLEPMLRSYFAKNKV